MGIDSMEVDSNHITTDTNENPFATFGQSNIGNITTYFSFDYKEEKKKR